MPFELHKILPGLKAEIKHLIITPDEENVIAGTSDTISQWEISKGKKVREFAGCCPYVDPHQKYLIFKDSTGIHARDFWSDQDYFIYSTQNDSFHAVINPYSNYLVLGFWQTGQAVMIDTTQWKVIRKIDLPIQPYNRIYSSAGEHFYIDPAGKLLAVYYNGQEITDEASFKAYQKIARGFSRTHPQYTSNGIIGVGFNHRHNLAILATFSGVYAWDFTKTPGLFSTEKPLQPIIQGYEFEIRKVAVDLNGSQFWILSQNEMDRQHQYLTRYLIPTGKVNGELKIPGSHTPSGIPDLLELAPYSPYLGVGSYETKTLILEFSGTCVHEGKYATSIALSEKKCCYSIFNTNKIEVYSRC